MYALLAADPGRAPPPPAHPTRLRAYLVLSQDEIHPYGETGHRYASDLLIALIQTTVASLEAHRWNANKKEAKWATERLPPPMIPNNYEHATSVCLLQVGVHGHPSHALRHALQFAHVPVCGRQPAHPARAHACRRPSAVEWWHARGLNS